MIYIGYIKVFLAVIVMMMASACVKSEVEYEAYGREISVAPVTSVATKSVPGPVFGNSYLRGETMGVMAFHNDGTSGWAPYFEEASADNIVEFAYVEHYGAWAGVTTGVTDNEKTVFPNPQHWPEEGSLIFAGVSPYFKYQHTYDDNATLEDKLLRVNTTVDETTKYEVSFDVASKTLRIDNYSVGRYTPMTSQQMADDEEYKNISQSDLMFFMPQADESGNYIGVNQMSAYPAHFRHALSMVEFTVRAADESTADRVDIDRITLSNVYHTGDFAAKINDDGSIEAGWPENKLAVAEDVNVFGDDDETASGLYLDLDPRTVAQLMVIPGPTHPIEVICHIYISGNRYVQTFNIVPDGNWEVGKRYVYNLIVGLNKITFAPETYEWNDADGGSYHDPSLNNNQ